MYPKVKVREQDEEDLPTAYGHGTRPLRPLEAFESLSMRDTNNSAQECEDYSPASIVRIPKSYISSSAFTGEGHSSNQRKAVEDCNQNIRASSIPRPRAVLSSPDNDGVIRSRSKAKPDLLSGLKGHNSCQNRHTRCKDLIPRRSTVETPLTTKRESKEASDGTPAKEKMGTATAVPRQRAHLRKGKT